MLTVLIMNKHSFTFGLGGQVTVVNIHPYDEYGMWIKQSLQRLAVYHSNGGVRTVNVWELKEKEIGVLYGKTAVQRGKVRLDIRKTKTSKTAEPYYITCTCITPNHELDNTACPLTIIVAHKQLKWADWIQFVQPRKPDLDYGEQCAFRRLRYIDSKRKHKGVYFSEQRWGEKHIRENTLKLTEIANVNVIVPSGNKRRTKVTCLVDSVPENDFLCTMFVVNELFI